MTDVAEQMRMWAIAESLRRTAPDQLHLMDRISFAARLSGADPASPQFDDVVRAAVRATNGPTAAEQAQEAAEAAERDRKRQAGVDAEARARRLQGGQWTQADLEASTPDEQAEAYRRGQLAAVGMPPVHRPEPRQAVTPSVRPSVAQVGRWNRMAPQAAQKARAAWHRDHAPGGDAA